MLVEDNTSGELAEVDGEEHRRLIYFPGAKRPAAIEYGPIRQSASIDGIPIMIGGENDPVSIHLQDRSLIRICRATRAIAREMAPHLFQTPIRASGLGTWFRDRDGVWEMRRFVIQSFVVLKVESVSEAARRLQALDTKLSRDPDPVAELMAAIGSNGDQ
jgi:hypothetical protein